MFDNHIRSSLLRENGLRWREKVEKKFLTPCKVCQTNRGLLGCFLVAIGKRVVFSFDLLKVIHSTLCYLIREKGCPMYSKKNVFMINLYAYTKMDLQFNKMGGLW